MMGAESKLITVTQSEIKEQRGSSISLMPEGLQAGLTLQEFTDLIEYLTTLQQPESTLLSNLGMPSVIPELAKPVTIRPFFSTEFKARRGPAKPGLTSM